MADNHLCPTLLVPRPAEVIVHKQQTIRDPVKLGSYSVAHRAGGRQFDPKPSGLTVLDLPRDLNNTNFDLTEGYKSLRDGGKIICSHTPDSEPGLVELLHWILENRSVFQLKSGMETANKLNTDFITYRGVLTKIMTMPYESSGDVLICASKYKGTIYTCLFTSPAAMAEEQSRGERENQMSYGGFRFEKYITKPIDATQEPQASSPDDKTEYCLVVRTRLGSHSLVYGAEMDCVIDPRKASDPLPRDFAEIKTANAIYNERQLQNRRRNQMLRWWAQCYLIGIRHVVCGNRNNSLNVQSIDRYVVHDLPKECKMYWSSDLCVDFLDKFLTFMKECMVHDDPNIVYEFYWSSKQQQVTCTLTRGKRNILYDWYINKL